MNAKRDISQERTAAEIEALEDKVGFVRTPEFVDDYYWVHAQYYSEEACERREREAWRELEAQGGTKRSIITVTPQGHFLSGNKGPLIEVLRRGEADAKLQAWLADQIESGGFASRKSKGAHERAVEIAALHYEVSLEKLKTYLKRGKKDRHRLPRIA